MFSFRWQFFLFRLSRKKRPELQVKCFYNFTCQNSTTRNQRDSTNKFFLAKIKSKEKHKTFHYFFSILKHYRHFISFNPLSHSSFSFTNQKKQHKNCDEEKKENKKRKNTFSNLLFININFFFKNDVIYSFIFLLSLSLSLSHSMLSVAKIFIFFFDAKNGIQ
jgi:hypothetical protein